MAEDRPAAWATAVATTAGGTPVAARQSRRKSAAAGEATTTRGGPPPKAPATGTNTAGGTPAAQVFPIRGGHRVRAGSGTGQVQVTAVVAGGVPESLRLTVAPVGDYSTYRLELIFDPARIDPFFATLDFKFRPGCFSSACAPAWEAGRPRQVLKRNRHPSSEIEPPQNVVGDHSGIRLVFQMPHRPDRSIRRE